MALQGSSKIAEEVASLEAQALGLNNLISTAFDGGAKPVTWQPRFKEVEK